MKIKYWFNYKLTNFCKNYLRKKGYSMYPLFSYLDLQEWLNEDRSEITPEQGSEILEEILDDAWLIEQTQYVIKDWLQENNYIKKED